MHRLGFTQKKHCTGRGLAVEKLKKPSSKEDLGGWLITSKMHWKKLTTSWQPIGPNMGISALILFFDFHKIRRKKVLIKELVAEENTLTK